MVQYNLLQKEYVGSERVVRDGMGMYILIAYLLWSIIGKSNYYLTGMKWSYYQFGNILFSIILVVFILVKLSERSYHSGQSMSALLARQSLGLFLVWAALSCTVQKRFVENMACFAVYGSMVVTLFFVPHLFVSYNSLPRFLRILALCVGVGAVVSLFAGLAHLPQCWIGGRLAGIYTDPITCANIAITASIMLCLYFAFPARWWLFSLGAIVVIVLSIIVILLARTRGAYLCTLICPICFIAHRMRQWHASKLLVFFMLLCIFSLVLITFYEAYDPNSELSQEVRIFARIDKPLEEVVWVRAHWWKAGLEHDLVLSNIFGQGILATYDWNLSSIKESGYNIERNRHNSFVSCAQYYGIPGLLLFVIFLLSLLYSFWKRKDVLAAVGFTVVVYSITRGMVSNHLLGFGSPMDRFSWLLLGLAFHFNSAKVHLKPLIHYNHTNGSVESIADLSNPSRIARHRFIFLKS